MGRENLQTWREGRMKDYRGGALDWSASLGKVDGGGEGRAKTAHQKSPACGRKAQISSSPGSVIRREQPRGNVGSA